MARACILYIGGARNRYWLIIIIYVYLAEAGAHRLGRHRVVARNSPLLGIYSVMPTSMPRRRARTSIRININITRYAKIS